VRSEEGEIVGITAGMTDRETAGLWRTESTLYRSEEFDTDDALAILAMNV